MSEKPEDVRDAAKSALCFALKDVRTGTAIKMSMFGPDKQAFEEAIARAILAERHRCVEVARTWEKTAKSVRQIEGEGVARDIRLCIAAGTPAAPKGGDA